MNMADAWKRQAVQQIAEGVDREILGMPSKAEVLEKILKDDTRGVRILPAPGYSHKMQTVRSNSLDHLKPLLPVTRAVGFWIDK